MGRSHEQSSHRGNVAWRVAGFCMALHWALIARHKWGAGVEGEMLWMSHVSLALAAVGLMLGSASILATVFIAIAGLHALWMFDALSWALTGRFPLGVTTFLEHMSALELLGTSHHFYLAPLLGVWLWAHRASPRSALPGAVGLFALLAVASRVVLPPSMNVNWSRGAWQGSDVMIWTWINQQHALLYMPMLVAVVAAVFMLPAAWALRAASRRPVNLLATIRAARLRPIGPRARRAFTLIELIAVMVVLAILAAVAVPRYFDHSAHARQSADEGSLAGIRQSLHNTFLNNRATGASSSSWVTSVNHIAAQMDTRALPLGITIVGTQLRDSRGNLYNLTAETATTPALITAATAPSGGGGSGSGGGLSS